jgi:hypothetical protein
MGLDGYEAGGDLSTGGQWLSEPGWYHVLVTEIQDPATDAKGVPISNAAFKAVCEVLAGTVDGQRGKSCDICFFNPKPQDKNEGAFAKKKIDRFLLATNHASEQELSTKGFRPNPDLQQMVGRQLVLQLEREGEKKYLSLAFADLYHVDDPAVKAYPKCAESLTMIQPKHRWLNKTATPAAKPATPAAPAKPATPVAPLQTAGMGVGAANASVLEDI